MNSNLNKFRFRSVILLLGWTSLVSRLAVFGQTGQLEVSAKANIYGAGHASAPAPAGGGAGILPPSISFTGGAILTFQISGQVSYNGGGNFYTADGLIGNKTQMNSLGGISGINCNSSMFLVGVFVDDKEPTGTPPINLDLSDLGFAELSPMMNQAFFIGDGLTGTGTGTVQRFHAPSGATRLFLGFADGSNFTGFPGSYLDDIGTLSLAYTVTAPVLAPKFQVERSGISFTQGFRFNLLANLNRTVRVEASTNLVDWQPVISFAAVSGSLEFIDSSATNFGRRYYRAVVP
jgi:hypothetical protein